MVAAQWAAQVPLFATQPGFAEAFLPDGRAPKAGELFTFPDHAATLEKIAASGGEEFYRGELAAALEAHSAANGGALVPGRFPPETPNELRQRGHQLLTVDDHDAFGSCQAIWRLDYGYLGPSRGQQPAPGWASRDYMKYIS